MTKMKKLLLALLMGTACAGVFAYAGCTDSGKEEGKVPDEPPVVIDPDIEDEDVPLGGGTCEHAGISHVVAVSAGCETAGNKEYWHCSDCGKYYSDADCTVETSLAAVTLTAVGHSYGGWVDEAPATCTEDGEKAHKDCTECGKHFDADDNEITDLTIAAGHNYGKWIEEVPAQGCTNGVHGHYHCDDCNTDFDEDYEEFGLLPFQAGSLTITATHNIKHYEAEDATCVTDGHEEYWQCEDCEEYFDAFGNIAFEAPMFLEGDHSYGKWIDEVPATCTSDGVKGHKDCTVCGKHFDADDNEIEDLTIAAGHKYGEFVYDYEAKKYVKVCANDETHTIEEIAGTAEFPYLASNAEQFLALLGSVKYISLSADIDLRATETSDTKSYTIKVDTVLDLNGHTLTTKMGLTVGIYNDAATPVLTVKNGTINRVVDSGSTANKATLCAQGNGILEVINSTITTNQDSAVTVWDSCKVTVTDSTLKGVYYALTSNAGNGNYTEAISVKLTNSSFEAQGAAILWNIPATIEIDGCVIKGLGQAMIARGGNITISNTTLIKRAYVKGADLDMLAKGDEEVYPTYENETWGSGNVVPGYALVVGNRSSAYQYATNVTLNNVKVEVEEGVVEKYVYAYGNTNPEYGATITYDADCELGAIVIGDLEAANGSNVTVIAPATDVELAA